MKHEPLFIIGAPRSGTTWLANILCNHSQIAGIQAKEHFGIIETGFFSCLPEYFGDLRNEDNFIVFLEAFSKSDYFTRAAGDKNLFYEKRPESYAQFLALLMDRYAGQSGARYWLEKTPSHTLHLDQIAHDFPDATFLCIHREAPETIGSMMNLFSSQSRSLPRKAFVYCNYNKEIRSFRPKTGKKITIEYAALKRDRETIIREVCSRLGIAFEPCLLQDNYTPNTSYRETGRHKYRFSTRERLYLKLLLCIFSAMPRCFFRFINYCFFLRRRVSRRPVLIPGTYYLLKTERFI